VIGSPVLCEFNSSVRFQSGELVSPAAVHDRDMQPGVLAIVCGPLRNRQLYPVLLVKTQESTGKEVRRTNL